MKINRMHLLQSLQNSIVGAERGEFLNNAFSFRDGYVHTFKDFVALSIFLGEEFKFLRGSIRAVEFFSLLSKYTGEDVEVEVGESSIDVSSGKSKASFTFLEESVLKQMDTMSIPDLKWKPVAENFREALNFCLLGVREYALEGIRVKGQLAVSVDSRRINQFQMKSDMGDFLIEEKVVTELLKFKNYKEFAESDQRIFLKLEDGTVVSGRKRVEVDYPLDKIGATVGRLAKAEKDPEGVLPSSFKQMIARASVLSIEWNNVDIIRLTFFSDHIQCESERTIGRYSERLEWEKSPQGLEEPVQVLLPPSSALYALEKSHAFYIKQEGGNKRLVFVGDGCKCVLAAYVKEKD